MARNAINTELLLISLQARDTSSGFTLIEENGSAERGIPASSSSAANGAGKRSSQASSPAPRVSTAQLQNGHQSMADMHNSLQQQSAAVGLAVAQVLLLS